MKKKNIIIFGIIIMIILIPIIAACTDNTPEEKETVYQQGIFQENSIYDQFECIGEKQSKTFMGSNGINTIYCQQTVNGGWVAWTARRYIYTPEDIGANNILNKAAIEFMSPLKFE